MVMTISSTTLIFILKMILASPASRLQEKRVELLDLVKSGNAENLFKVFEERNLVHSLCANPFCINPPCGKSIEPKDFNFADSPHPEWFCSRPSCFQGCMNILNQIQSQIREIIETEDGKKEVGKKEVGKKENGMKEVGKKENGMKEEFTKKEFTKKEVSKKSISVFKASKITENTNSNYGFNLDDESDSFLFENDEDEDEDDDGDRYFGGLSLFGRMHALLSDCFKIRSNAGVLPDIQEKFMEKLISGLGQKLEIYKMLFDYKGGDDHDFMESLYLSLRKRILDMPGLSRQCLLLSPNDQVFFIALLFCNGGDEGEERCKAYCLDHMGHSETLLNDLLRTIHL